MSVLLREEVSHLVMGGCVPPVLLEGSPKSYDPLRFSPSPKILIMCLMRGRPLLLSLSHSFFVFVAQTIEFMSVGESPFPSQTAPGADSVAYPPHILYI